MLLVSASVKADIVEHYDNPWQIVAYSVTGTTGDPHAIVKDIAFEANGDLWRGRQDGLFFFDGYEWKRFGVEHGLPSNVCRAVKVTQDGVLWVGTDRGCGTFDGVTFETHGSKQGLAGPSIKRIYEDPDGTLWFCCDRWPEAKLSAGLTSFSDGRWRNYGLADGLPSDQLNDYHRDSKGNQYAVTAKGIARRSGDRWEALDIPGFPVGGFPFDLSETPTGELICSLRIAPGNVSVFMTKEGRWHDLGNPANKSFVTRDGQILSTEIDIDQSRMRVIRYEDGKWTPASAWTRNTRLGRSDLIEAPDGAIWGVGRGFFRWENADPQWSHFSGLPALVNVDSRGQVWFSGDEGTWLLRNDHFVAAPALDGKTWLEREGRIWCGHNGALVEVSVDSLRIERSHPIDLGHLRQIVLDVEGNVWVWLALDGHDEVQVFSDGDWKVLPPELLSHGRLKLLKADARSGVLVVLMCQPAQSQLRRFNSDFSVHDISMPPGAPIIGHVWSDRLGTWATGSRGLLYAPAGEDAVLSDVERFHDAHIHKTKFTPATTCFSAEFSDGGSSLWSFDGQNWKTIRNQNPANIVSSGEGQPLYFSMDDKLYIYSGEHETPLRFMEAPWNGPVSRVRHQANGNIWFLQDGQSLRYRPRKTKPRPAFRMGASKIISGDDSPTPVSFSAINRFEPCTNSESFNYWWRMDAGGWSPFTDTPEKAFSLGDLSIGKHVLQLRAINLAGMVSDSVSEATFSIHPVPIQQRPWFLAHTSGCRFP
ncbi:MAG: two-component regulator propeller domain-containing protein [Fuerstiella sp.]